MMQLVVDSIEGTQLGRRNVGSYECPWVSRYCDLVGRWDVFHEYSIYIWGEGGGGDCMEVHGFHHATLTRRTICDKKW